MIVDVTPVLRREPDTVAEAVDVHARLTALSDWVAARKKAVAGWVEGRALDRLAEDGAAPTWRVDGGTALLTDPAPRPAVADQETFARWFVRDVCDADPDTSGRDVPFADGRVRRLATATVPSDVLLDFLDEGVDHVTLTAAIVVVDDWLLSATLLDDLIVGKVGADANGRPRVAVDGLAAVDTTTGELVPGVVVQPPTARTVQIRPSAATKKQIRAELLTILGPAALPEAYDDEPAGGTSGQTEET